MAALNEPQTLVEHVQRWASEHGERIAFEFVTGAEGSGQRVSYGELDARARALAWALHSHKLAGQPVLVLCPAGFEYVCALLGCFYAGAIAVPAYPPARTGLARNAPRIAALIADSGARVALTTWDAEELGDSALSAALANVALLRCDQLASTVAANSPPGPDPSAPALLQYTSGSTALPRGVLLTHAHLLANQQLIQASGAMTSADITLSWLPPYHDMGLIAGIFLPLFLRTHGVLMPPETFLRRPRRWLSAITAHRASILMAPNFAFELCLSRIPPAERQGLDLSCVRLAYNGAEPVRAATLAAFTEAFAAQGFRPEAFYPCYGMAEATLIISGGAPGRAPVVRTYESAELERGRAVESAAESEAFPGEFSALQSQSDHDTAGESPSELTEELTSDPPALTSQAITRQLVGCGCALLDESILIVDPADGRVLPNANVGEIWVHSRSVALGYWNQPEQTAATFGARTAEGQGPYLRTGDLGFFDRGELFITGRIKDLIILHGRNHYPHDIERTVQGLSQSLVADGGAAFSVEIDDVEQLVVVQELDRRRGPNADALLAAVPQAIRAAHEVAAYAVVLIKRGSLYKTSSGKVQRRATKQAFLAGTLQVLASWERPRARRTTSPSGPADTQLSAEGTSDGAESLAADARTPAHTQTRPVPLRRQGIEAWLREQLAARLQLPAEEIDVSAPLAQYGVDSIVTSELTEALERLLGIELPATISYDNPTITDLSHALAKLLGSESGGRRQRAVATTASALAGDTEDPIAIVGMACRLPGAPSLASFWQLLRYGVDAIGDVPLDRWDAEALYAPAAGTAGRSYGKWGGFVHDLDRFDAPFFGISAREAAHMDPQQRMFLELVWHALEDAGQSPHALAGGNAGVFAGVSSNEYALLHRGSLALVDAGYGTGRSTSLVSNRVSYFLDLKGPSVTVDSACASSLV
ncbi:MAG TPA: AMP-binding protein, partial [Polyangiales bacterium]|nr:AMP-binding protein [Polyangiales bacterium]